METLRLAGIGFGCAGLLFVWIGRFYAHRLRNVDCLVGIALSLSLILLGLFPHALDAALALFAFEPGGGGRLIGLLILSNLILYWLVFSALGRGQRSIQLVDQLVRELAKREFREHRDGPPAEIWVVIPAYNEAENIGDVLERIPSSVGGLRTKPLVIVDGATDDTEAVVRGLDRAALSYTMNRGGGSALRAGYEMALEADAEIVVTLDADGQHRPEEIPDLVAPILDGRADLVCGSRVLGSYEKDDRVRALGVVLFNWLVSLLTLRRITDCSNSFRAIRVSALRQLSLRQTQFHTSELLLEAIKKGLRTIEVPITVMRRTSGESKKGPTLRYAWGFTRAIFSTWLR